MSVGVTSFNGGCRLGASVWQPLLLAVTLVSAVLASSACQAEKSTDWLASWGVNLEMLSPLSAHTPMHRKEILVRSVFRKNNEVFLSVEARERVQGPRKATHLKSFLVNFGTGEVSEVRAGEAKIKPGLVELPITDTVISQDGMIYSEDACGRYSLTSSVWTAKAQFFLVRQIILAEPELFPMSRGHCAEEFYDSAAPPIKTHRPVVAGTVEFVDLGDGTVLAWDANWVSDIIRFRIADGSTAYRPKTVIILSFDQVQSAFTRARYKPDEFLRELNQILLSNGGEP